MAGKSQAFRNCYLCPCYRCGCTFLLLPSCYNSCGFSYSLPAVRAKQKALILFLTSTRGRGRYQLLLV